MKAQLKEISSLQLNCILDDFRPEDITDFGILVYLMIGVEDQQGSDEFDLFICTPDWLKKQLSRGEKSMWGRHMLIVAEYDLEMIKSKINSHIESCTGNDWLTIANKLSRIAQWEFEDYRPYPKS